MLEPLYPCIKLTTTRPNQIVIRMSTFTILIFTSGQCRVMGKLSLVKAQSIIDSLSFIYYSVLVPIHKVSETCVFQLDSLYLPVNLYKFASEHSTDSNVQFEPELFPSVVLHQWKPLHVNVFSTGKVVVLGCNASQYVKSIHDWLSIQLLLL